MQNGTKKENPLRNITGAQAYSDHILDRCRELINSLDMSLTNLAQLLGDSSHEVQRYLKLRHIMNEETRPKLDFLVRLLALRSADGCPLNEDIYCFLERQSVAFLQDVVKTELFCNGYYIGQRKSHQFKRHNAQQFLKAESPQLLSVYKLLCDLQPSAEAYKLWLMDAFSNHPALPTLEPLLDRFVNNFLSFFDFG